MGRDAGLDPRQLAELADYRESDAFSDLERACLELADAMTAVPVEVSDALYEPIAAELEPAQIVELTSTIAWENYRSRFNRALAIESDGFSEGAFCPMAVRATLPG